MKCWTDIHGSKKMYPNDFGDPLTFVVLSEMAQPLGLIPIKYATHIPLNFATNSYNFNLSFSSSTTISQL